MSTQKPPKNWCAARTRARARGAVFARSLSLSLARARTRAPPRSLLSRCRLRAPPSRRSDALYGRHAEAMRTYLRRSVVGAVSAKKDVFMLQELVARWESHKIMNRWMFKIFQYLDRYYVDHHNLCRLEENGKRVFKEVVFDAIQVRAQRRGCELAS